jgi:adenine-specific DNA-methyltransferase
MQMKKGVLNEMLNSWSLDEIEKHLIYQYLITNNVDYGQNQILQDYLIDFQRDEKLISKIDSLEIKVIKELESYLELLIPEDDRKLNGAFFTPNFIVNFIIEEISPKENEKCLDPSCGCGAFLIGLVEYFSITFSKPIKKTVRENIFGADILAYNIHRAKLLLAIYALQHGENLENGDFNLYVQDSLKATWTETFDNIIGNPPYVKFQDLSEESRTSLAKKWRTIEGGTFNLYFAFFELGHQLLKPAGKLGFITPNNYFTSLSGISLRKYFQQNKCVYRIIDFSHKKVFDAQTYTALTFINKKENQALSFDRIKPDYEPEDFLPVANGTLNYLKDLDSQKWRLLKSDEKRNIDIIENIGTPIGVLFDICVGILTTIVRNLNGNIDLISLGYLYK